MRSILLAAALAAGPATADVLVVDPEAHFPEGPVVVDGVLHYVEYAGGTLMRWDGTGAPAEFWRRDGCGPSGTLPFAGGFLVTCYDSGELAHVSAAGETVAVVAADAAGAPLVGPNDLAPDGAGGAWMTASGPWDSAPIAGKVYHVAADLTLTEAADDLHYANGIVQLGSTLYVAESEAARIIAFDIGAGGALSGRRLFVRIGQADAASGPWAYPDGLRLGPDGNIWAGSYAMGRLVAIAPDGSLARAIDVPGATAPNLAFGPAGEIYVVTVDQTDAAPYAGRVLRVE
ncbi:MAG: SMP-30/gluconolactonase/LRE family protein [Rhodobacteraceae bacterium]|jgi:sugar lactone lactonase YvrE|nr:SMP-30/gluconolactonase/LRE family protein [Paracoccaceae bacterium]